MSVLITLLYITMLHPGQRPALHYILYRVALILSLLLQEEVNDGNLHRGKQRIP